MWKACSRRRTGPSDGKVHSVIRGQSILLDPQLKLAEQVGDRGLRAPSRTLLKRRAERPDALEEQPPRRLFRQRSEQVVVTLQKRVVVVDHARHLCAGTGLGGSHRCRLASGWDEAIGAAMDR
jgi:hypothetical protein